MEKRGWVVVKGLAASMGFFVGTLILWHLRGGIALRVTLRVAILGAVVSFGVWMGAYIVDSKLRSK